MTTPTQPLDLHAGARKIAERYQLVEHVRLGLAAEIAALAEAHAAPLREALDQFKEWAAGPTTGMGGGLHVAMRPPLTPAARKEMERLVRDALAALDEKEQPR